VKAAEEIRGPEDCTVVKDVHQSAPFVQVLFPCSTARGFFGQPGSANKKWAKMNGKTGKTVMKTEACPGQGPHRPFA